MAKWLTALALIVALAGGVLAGMPLHSGEQECAMTEMSGEMDCCAKAREQVATPEVAGARLCCAINCPSSGTPTPTSSAQSVSPLAIVIQNPASIQSPFVIPSSRLRFELAQENVHHSRPTYIRHLALLI